MNRRSSSWTGRSHRTLNSAFGPYTSPHICETRRTPAWHRWVYVVYVAAFIIGILIPVSRA